MDEVNRAAYKHAEALYKAGRKAEAIEALRKIDDPVARRTLAQISGKAVAQVKPQTRGGRRYARNIVLAIIASFLLVFLAGFIYSLTQQGKTQQRTEVAWTCWDFSFTYGYELGKSVGVKYSPDLDACYEWADYMLEYYPRTVDKCLEAHETDEARTNCFSREGIDMFPKIKRDD